MRASARAQLPARGIAAGVGRGVRWRIAYRGTSRHVVRKRQEAICVSLSSWATDVSRNADAVCGTVADARDCAHAPVSTVY